MENGRHVVKPMRYQCRLAHLSAESDRQFASCYNARRDNLEGFWGKEFATRTRSWSPRRSSRT
jgi:hypothetical protein